MRHLSKTIPVLAVLMLAILIVLFSPVPWDSSITVSQLFSTDDYPESVALNELVNDEEDIKQEEDNSTEPISEVIKYNSFDLSTQSRIPSVYEITGRVLDSRGIPIEAALIANESSHQSTRSDAEGYYRLFVTKPKNKYPMLVFLRDGYREERQSALLDQPLTVATQEINVTLNEFPGTTSVTGWIGDNLGYAVAGASIKIRSRGIQRMDNFYYSVLSNEKGIFQFEGIRSGVSYKLEVPPGERYPYYVIDALEVSKNTPPLNIVIDRLSLVNVTGMVVDSNAMPVPELKLRVENLSTHSATRTIVTDSSGFFNLNQFPSGELQFSGKVPDYFKVTGVRLATEEYQNITLVIDQGWHYLSGWVSDASGLPIAKARVTLDAQIDNADSQSYSFRSRLTDNAGRFAFENIADIEHVITVYAKGFQKREIYHRFKSGNDYLPIQLLTNSSPN